METTPHEPMDLLQVKHGLHSRHPSQLLPEQRAGAHGHQFLLLGRPAGKGSSAVPAGVTVPPWTVLDGLSATSFGVLGPTGVKGTALASGPGRQTVRLSLSLGGSVLALCGLLCGSDGVPLPRLQQP